MAKYSGMVGYAIQREVRPDIWESVPVERKMRGDVYKLSNRVDSGSKVNDDITLNTTISLIADPFAYENFTNLKYVTYLGVKWKVTEVDIQRPRLVLTIGGI